MKSNFAPLMTSIEGSKKLLCFGLFLRMEKIILQTHIQKYESLFSIVYAIAYETAYAFAYDFLEISISIILYSFISQPGMIAFTVFSL